jgi:hypothetical protein
MLGQRLGEILVDVVRLSDDLQIGVAAHAVRELVVDDVERVDVDRIVADQIESIVVPAN